MPNCFHFFTRVRVRPLISLWLAVNSLGFTYAQSAPMSTVSTINPKLMNAELISRGRDVYSNHCIGCHGETGEGDGPAADRLSPKPRNFTTGTFKFRSTPTGFLPTDEDLFKTVRQGAIGSSMPSYSLMAERDVLAVIQYLKTYSEAWIDPERHTNPISIPTVPAWFRDVKEVEIRSAKGKVVYDQLCLSCHGESGDGRGPSAETLTDSWDHPVQPADLRKPYVRSGRTLGDLYRVLVTGVGGSPMPSYLESTTEEQRWEIVAYIHTLRLQHKKARKGFQ